MTKKSHVCTVDCPWCGKNLDVLKETKVITPAVKAEKVEKYVTAKVLQKKLSEQ